MGQRYRRASAARNPPDDVLGWGFSFSASAVHGAFKLASWGETPKGPKLRFTSRHDALFFLVSASLSWLAPSCGLAIIAIGGSEVLGLSVFAIGALAYLARRQFADLPDRHEEKSRGWSWQMRRDDRSAATGSASFWEEALSAAGLSVEKGLVYRRALAIVSVGIFVISAVANVAINASHA
jgi:hypothetical protein